MKINFYVAVVVMFVLMVIVPPIILFGFKKKPKVIKIFTIVLSAIYFVLLIIGTTAKVYLSGTDVVISYPNSAEWFSMRFAVLNGGKVNILINLALLFPLGFIVYVFSDKNNFLKTIILAFLVSFIIELYQFVLPINRSTELADLLFNTISGLISATYCQILSKFGAFGFKNK